ncbi:26028_t:CDS:2, partial [Gigaspora rosea]
EIEQETLENIESLRDFQYWYQKILEATILTQQLQNNLNDLRLVCLEYWIKYIEEYNSFERIRVLLDQQQEFNYQKIRDGILGETILTNLE